MRYNDMLREAQLSDEAEMRDSFSGDGGEPAKSPPGRESKVFSAVEEATDDFKKRIIDLLRHQAAEL